MTNVTHEFLSMYLSLFSTLYMFRAHRAHDQERQILSIQPPVTVTLCWWPCKWPTWRTNCFLCIYLYFQLSTCFEHIVLIIRRDKLSIQPLVAATLCRVHLGSEHRCGWFGGVAARRCSLPTCILHSHQQSDSYQRLYWHNLSILMMSTMCSKHVESWK